MIFAECHDTAHCNKTIKSRRARTRDCAPEISISICTPDYSNKCFLVHNISTHRNVAIWERANCTKDLGDEPVMCIDILIPRTKRTRALPIDVEVYSITVCADRTCLLLNYYIMRPSHIWRIMKFYKRCF